MKKEPYKNLVGNLPCGAVIKTLPRNAGDIGLGWGTKIPGWGTICLGATKLQLESLHAMTKTTPSQINKQ